MVDGGDSLAGFLSAMGALALSIAAWIGGQRYSRRFVRAQLDADQTQIYYDGPLNAALGSLRNTEATLRRIEDGLETIARLQHSQAGSMDDQARTVANLRDALDEQSRVLKTISNTLDELSRRRMRR